MAKPNVMTTAMALGFLAVSTLSAAAFEKKSFDAAAFKAAQGAGGPVLVHVTAPWCPTCKAQHQALGDLEKKPEFAKLVVFDVDFDSQKDALKSFNATSQSTLIVFKGATETGRSVGVTAAPAIAELLATAAK